MCGPTFPKVTRSSKFCFGDLRMVQESHPKIVLITPTPIRVRVTSTGREGGGKKAPKPIEGFFRLFRPPSVAGSFVLVLLLDQCPDFDRIARSFRIALKPMGNGKTRKKRLRAVKTCQSKSTCHWLVFRRLQIPRKVLKGPSIVT